MNISLQKCVTITLSFILMVVFLTGCSFSFTLPSTTVLKREDAKEYIVEKTATETITKIDINTRIADVVFVPSDNFYVEINYLYWEEQPEYSLVDGKLYFNDSHALPNSYSLNYSLNNQITIYLPADAALDSLSVDTSSGDVSLLGFVAKDLKVDIAYGDLILEQAAAVKSRIDLSCGDSDITDFQTGILDFDSSYGDSDFTDINTGNLKLPTDVIFDDFSVNSSSGNITINGLTCNTVTIKDSYGDVNCTDVHADDLKSDLSSGDIDISESDLTEIRLNNSYGDAELSLLGEESDYSLNLTTSYGDIQVGDKNYDDHFKVDNDGERKLSASLSSGDITVNFDNQE